MFNSNIHTVLNFCVHRFKALLRHKPLISLSYLFIFIFSTQAFAIASDICVSCDTVNSEVATQIEKQQQNQIDFEVNNLLKHNNLYDNAHEDCLDCQSTFCCSLLMFASTPVLSYFQKTSQSQINFKGMTFDAPYYSFLRPPKV